MNKYLVDLHIHTLLSPCGDLGMSPRVIVEHALAAGLDAIAICDHNSLHQAPLIRDLGAERGLEVFIGAELTTREEAHCVALLPGNGEAVLLQEWVDRHIMKTKNVPEKFGDQVWVDRDENIAGEVEWYLNMPLDKSVEEIAEKVQGVGGLFVAAHVERPSYSIIGQLGFISPGVPLNAVEYNNRERFDDLKAAGHKYLNKYTAYTASDAHFHAQIGTNPSYLYAERLTFGELRRAMAAEDGRRIVSAQGN